MSREHCRLFQVLEQQSMFTGCLGCCRGCKKKAKTNPNNGCNQSWGVVGGGTEGIKTPVNFWGHLGFMAALITLHSAMVVSPPDVLAAGGRSSWGNWKSQTVCLFMYLPIFLSVDLVFCRVNTRSSLQGEVRKDREVVLFRQGMCHDASLLPPALYVPSLCHLKMAEKKWAAVKCKIQHPLDHWCFLIGALVRSPPFQKQFFFFKIVILTYISDMELNKIDSNCCVCHANDYWLERPKINTVFQKWIGWVNSF